MSDLVRREEVLRVLEEEREECRKVWTPTAVSITKRIDRYQERVRALPAIGTCATCAEWRRVNHRDEVWGDCTNADLPWANKGYDFHPDFFCAAWRAKQ